MLKITKTRTASKVAQLAAVAATVPILVLTNSTSAAAWNPPGGVVTWENNETHVCLNWSDDMYTRSPKAQVGDCHKSNSDVSNWWEVPVDSTWWTFHPTRVDKYGNTDNLCLTSYNSLVYLETCQPGNWWQQWQELKMADGVWRLRHRGAGAYAGFFLDTNGRDLYTHPENSGNFQNWH
ncbi:hypothetical protein [Streptomyces sp. NPDC093225]|uniref:hypothetical protein n=1 Tax=Streptomyces sp. NPDC093225 TaxID=3366034 RepID=UPI0038267884